MYVDTTNEKEVILLLRYYLNDKKNQSILHMERCIPAIAVALVLCLLLPCGLLYTTSKQQPVERETFENELGNVIPFSVFDGEDAYSDGRWFLLRDGRLADMSDGRVYMTDLEFSPFELIEDSDNALLADGKRVHIYHAKVYPRLQALNSEYATLKERFPQSVISVVSTLHLAVTSNGRLYIFTGDGALSVFSVEWELYGDDKTLFEQICLFYEYPDDFHGDNRYYIFDGGDLRCFNTTFGELGIF